MTIVSEVAQAYYELVALDTELEIVRQTQKAREEGVRLARIRFEGGLTSETSYQQAQVELARTATLVPDLERKISIKENDIAFLAGEFPTRIERSRFLQELDVPESLPVGLRFRFAGTSSRYSCCGTATYSGACSCKSGLYQYVSPALINRSVWIGE